MGLLFALFFLLAPACLAQEQVDHLPPGAQVIEAKGQVYFYAGGYFYRQRRNDYLRVEPPLGARVSNVPVGTVFFLNGRQYKLAGNGTFFLLDPKDHQYVVVTPPHNWRHYNQNPLAPQIEIYPRAYPPKHLPQRKRKALRRLGGDSSAQKSLCEARAANLARSIHQPGKVSWRNLQKLRREYRNCLREYRRRGF